MTIESPLTAAVIVDRRAGGYSLIVLSGLDHLIVAVADPDAGAAGVEGELGLRSGGGGRHDAHGTFNRLIWLGDSYLELMGVFDPALAAESWWGTHISRVLAETHAGYAGLALASDDLVTDVARLRGMGSRISDPIAGERQRPDGDIVRWQVARLPEPDPELGLVFLIEHDMSAAEWRPAEREARAAAAHPVGTAGRLARVDLHVADVGGTTMRLLRDLGLQFRPSLAGRRARDTSIGRQTLRLSTGVALPEVTISAGYEEYAVDLLGLRWRLIPAR